MMLRLSVLAVVPVLEAGLGVCHVHAREQFELELDDDVLERDAGDSTAVLEVPFESVPLPTTGSASFVARVPLDGVLEAARAGREHIVAAVETQLVRVPAQPVHVHVSAPNVEVVNTIEAPNPARRIELERDAHGRLAGARVRDEIRKNARAR